MSSTVRVRFAPSPTGPLHIGGIRTALYNYLFAKKHSGTFILRIEDTDQKRYVPNAEQYIVDALDWCGIPFDEGPKGAKSKGSFGPYRQSERKHLYRKYADILIDKGWAYFAFDTPEQLSLHRKKNEENGETFIYNWHNRKAGELMNSLVLSKEEVQEKINAGQDYVIRFKSPKDEILTLHDEIRGTIKIDTNTLDDKVIFKSDGMPTYHLANVVDDHLMEISHVIRGEEWLPSLSLHVLLYKAFEWEVPLFAHLPLILKPVGKGKLSKRDGDQLGFPVFPLSYFDEETRDVSRGYREEGYFSDAFINMLSLLGWNPGTTQEIFSLNELIEVFDLSRVSKSGAKFNLEKTRWFNQQYLQQKDNSLLAESLLLFLSKKNIYPKKKYVEKVISLIKERAFFISDFWVIGAFFFEAPRSFDQKASRKKWKENTGIIMNDLAHIILSINNFISSNIESKVKAWITEQNMGFGSVMQPLRLSLVGALHGPHLFDIIEMIGKEETINRIQHAIKELS